MKDDLRMTSPVGDDLGAARAVGKSLAVLGAFRRYGHTLGVSRLAVITGLPKSTVHRLAVQLVEAGFLIRSGSAYRVGALAYEVGSAYIHCTHRGLVPLAGPHLASLFECTGATVGLYVPDDEGMLLMDQVIGSPLPEPTPQVGQRVAGLSTAPAKALAAFHTHGWTGATRLAVPVAELEEIRDSGLSVDAGELLPGLASAASPVLVGERPVAALAVSAPLPRADLPFLRPAVLRAARRLASDFVDARRDLEDYGPASPLHDVLTQERP